MIPSIRELKKIDIPNKRRKVTVTGIEERRNRKLKFYIDSETVKIQESEILIMYFYENNKNKPKFRVFLDKEDYKMQNTYTGEWYKGCIENVFQRVESYCDCWNWWEISKTSIKAEKEINDFMKKNKFKDRDISYYSEIWSKNKLFEVHRFQKKIIRNRLKKKYKEITDVIDAKMSLIPSTPEDFKNWCEEIALKESRYIVYEYTEKPKKKGYCTHCGKRVYVYNCKNNDKGICPECGSNITYKSKGKAKMHDEGRGALIQRLKNGEIVVRHFDIYKDYRENFKKPRLNIFEIKRDIFITEGKTETYEYKEFRQTGKRRWCNDNCYMYSQREALYDDNLDELKDTEFRYSAIKEMATHEEGYKFDVSMYMSKYRKWKKLEYVVKMKLYNMARDIVKDIGIGNTINFEAKKPNELLMISKENFKIAQEIDADLKELKVIQKAEDLKLKITPEEVREISKEFNHPQTFIKAASYSNIRKAFKYIRRIEGMDLCISANLYCDYLEFADELGYDMKSDFTLFPKKLKEVHDYTSELLTEKRTKDQSEKIKNRYKETYDKYKWQYNGYEIVVPKDTKDLIDEGQANKHCVANYARRVAEGETTILFLRKSEEINKTLYTIEVKNGELIQCRTKHNHSYEEDKEIKKIVNKFIKDVLKKLNKKVA